MQHFCTIHICVGVAALRYMGGPHTCKRCVLYFTKTFDKCGSRFLLHYDLHLEFMLCDLAAHAFKPVVYRGLLCGTYR